MGFQSYHKKNAESNSRAEGFCWMVLETRYRYHELELFTFRLRSLPENRSSHPHQSCSLLHCDRKILSHSHRQLRQIDMELRLQTLSQLSQPNKILSRSFRFIGDRWNTHQTQDGEPRQTEQRFHCLAHFVRLKSKLTPL